MNKKSAQSTSNCCHPSLLLLLVSLILAGCAGQTVTTPCDDSLKLLSYYDSATFDTALSRILSCNPETMNITLPTPEKTNAIPKRLDNWLAAVDAAGGSVKVLADPDLQAEYKSKGFDGGFVIGVIVDLVEVAKIAYQQMRDKQLYMSAKNYNAFLYFEEGTGRITRLVFTRK